MNRADWYREIGKNVQLAGEGLSDMVMARSCYGYSKFWYSKAVAWETKQKELWDLREKLKAPKWSKK